MARRITWKRLNEALEIRMRLRFLVLAVILAAFPSAAWSQCGTTAPANKFCGNDTGASALAGWRSIPPGALGSIAGGTVLGNTGTSTAAPAATTSPVLGIPGTSTGQIGLAGLTSGTAVLRAQAAAGSAVVLLPTVAGTLVSTASSPLAINSTTGLISITGVAGRVLSGAGPTFTATPTLGTPGSELGVLQMAGNVSGTVSIRSQATAGSPTLTLPNASGTFAVSATAPLALSATTGELTITSAALTKTDDTNVTLTLGGTPASSLLAATSLTLGWTGQLSLARGGTGQATATAAFAALAPTASVAGSLLHWNGSAWAAVAGNASGTNCLQENASGVPSWGSCGGTTSLTVGTTGITSGTTTRVLYDNAGTLGEYTVSGSGSVAMTTSPSFTTPTLGAAIGTSLALGGATLGANALAVTGSSLLTGAVAVTSASANALAVGANGATNPGLQVDASTASAATGIKVTSKAATGGVNIDAVSSSTNEGFVINAKGSGGITIGNTSTGALNIGLGGGGVTITAATINTSIAGSAFGTNVATALGTAASAANGFPLVIASGTIALGTSAVSAGSCSAAATSAATGVATTDVIDVTFNGDPTATTGYTAAAMLSIMIYPSANTVNVKQCNTTPSSITPAALTLNWKVRR